MSKARENYSNHIVAFQHTKTNMLLGQTHKRVDTAMLPIWMVHVDTVHGVTLSIACPYFIHERFDNVESITKNGSLVSQNGRFLPVSSW